MILKSAIKLITFGLALLALQLYYIVKELSITH